MNLYVLFPELEYVMACLCYFTMCLKICIVTGDLTREELASVMAAHEQDMNGVLTKLDHSRDQQAALLRAKLAERRRNKQKAMHEKHCTEVRISLDHKWQIKTNFLPGIKSRPLYHPLSISSVLTQILF